jgi:pimeloyl-ACP methyl ester carboxylesterase
LSDARLEEIWGDSAWHEVPLLVLYGDSDQYVPAFVDKVKLLEKWQRFHNAPLPDHIARRSRFQILTDANHEIVDSRSVGGPATVLIS